jgi:hypothetical protein
MVFDEFSQRITIFKTEMRTMKVKDLGTKKLFVNIRISQINFPRLSKYSAMNRKNFEAISA